MLGAFAEDFRLLDAVLQRALRICFNPRSIAQVPRRVSLLRILPACTEMNNHSGTGLPYNLRLFERSWRARLCFCAAGYSVMTKSPISAAAKGLPPAPR